MNERIEDARLFSLCLAMTTVCAWKQGRWEPRAAPAAGHGGAAGGGGRRRPGQHDPPQPRPRKRAPAERAGLRKGALHSRLPRLEA